MTATRFSPELMDAALALHDNRLSEAERGLKAYLKRDPFDARAIRMLAELAGRIGRLNDAENLLRRAVELAPAFTAARANLALVLYRQNRAEEALAELDALIDAEPDHPGHANLKAAALGRLGAFEEAITLYERVLADAPEQPKLWMSYGHMLKTVGRQADGIAAYRRAIALRPDLGEAWWSLANLKTVRFDDADIAAMEAARAAPDLGDEDRFHLDFALGKACEDRGDADRAFGHYAAGNALRRTQLVYDADETERFVDDCIALATPEFLLLGQLGDGDLILVDGSGTVSRPLPIDPRCFGEETSSLCLPDAPTSLRVLATPVPEGHSLHRLARGLPRTFAGHEVASSRPQGRRQLRRP